MTQRCEAQRSQGDEPMKAMVMGELGLANLALRDVPDPKPGPGQVLVRMRAASLNFRDLLTLDGKYGSMQKRENLILLSDGAGEIVEVGAGVKEWKAGDRVVGCFFPHWQDGEPQEYLLRDAPGGLADGVACQYPRVRSRCDPADSAATQLRRSGDACRAPR